VQKDIDKTLPVLETHLSRANQVAATLTKPDVKSDSTAAAKPPVAKPPVATPPAAKPPV